MSNYLSKKRNRHQSGAQFNDTTKSPQTNRGFEYSQQNLFTPSGPRVSLEPLPHRHDRVRLTIVQEDSTWGLVPHLSRDEGKRLLDLLRAARVEFDLNLEEGWPIDSNIIQAAVETLIDSGVVAEVVA